MFKNFSLLLLLSISFSAHGMQDERIEEPKRIVLKKHQKMAAPSVEEDIQPYETAYGALPQHLKKFYTTHGNCTKEGLDLLHIYKGEDSGLGKATKYIRGYLPDYYHAFAFHQGEGGYWVYDARETNIVFELFDTSRNALRKGEKIVGLKALLLKYS